MNLRTLNLLGICFVLTVLASLFPAASFAIQPPPDAGHAPGSTEFSTPAFRVSPALEIYEVGSTRAYSLGAVPDFFAGYSERWEVRWDVRSDRPHLIQGVGIPLLPGRGNDLRREELGLSQARDLGLRDVEGLLRGFMAEQSGLLGISQIDLRLDPERSLVYGANDYLWLMEFQQFHEGVPVERAKVFFRVNHGNIIQFGTSHVADVEIDTTPTVNRLRALRSGLKAVGASRPSWMVDRGSLKIYPTMGDDEKPAEAYLGANGMGYQHRLVWEFVFRLEGDDHAYKLVVDAHSGKVLEYLDLARFATVQGDVYPVTNTDPLETVGFPYCSVSNSGTKITDADGNYTYSGGTATVQLNGRYTSISDNCGSISLSDSTDGNIDFGGSTGTDCTTPGYGGSGNTHSARTGFYHLTNINRKAATYLPSNTWLDSTLTANMNINDTCNAYWSGSSGDVNFYRSGGGCSNTGEIAAVFLHEWGHGLDDNTGGSASDQGSGEALGDTFAFLELREACIGENFQPGSPCHNCNSYCTGVRDLAAFATGGISTIARPDTVTDNSGINCDRWTCPYYSGSWPYQGPMGYEGHCESYIAGSANWDLAQLLVAEHGTEPGWAAMNDIWYGSITPAQEAYQVTSGGTCNPSASVDGCASDNWYTVYLSVDDDDGNLANGTPNGCRIWDAFDAHGIACGTRPACSGGCTPQPIVDAGTDQTICLGDSTTIGTAAQADHSYSWSPGGYTVAQPTVSPTTTTTYTVTATTTCGSADDSVVVTVDTGGGGGLDDDFEGGLGSWSTSGLWHLVSNSSCASPGYASAVNAVYYGQDSSCDYATGSATTGDLISPEISGINAGSTLSFNYFRQVESYSGAYDKAEVAVSAVGSSTWTTVWSRDSSDTSENAWTASGDISLSAFADQSVQVRFRFDSVDGTYNNFTGWFIDDVVVVADSPCVGNTAPTVNITAPADGSTYDDNDSITFTGTANDTEDGNITASLSWSSSIDGTIGSGGSFSTTLSVGTHTITASVTDSGGLPGSDAITVYVNPANTAPTVTITAPADGSGYTAGDSITFTGTANDTEDGNITASLSWTSSIDGTIGSGGSFSTTTLSLGTHTITASVTDSGGLPGSDAITVYVNPAGDYLNFNDYPTVAYSTQDGSGSFEIQDGGLTFSMVGNRWRRTSATFEITPYTVLEFDFKSTSQGEIHAIGFDEDDTLTNDVRMFRVFGTQSWASDIDVADPYTTGDMGTYVHFTVRVGEYYTGSAMYLVLVNDKDSGTLDNTGWFTNVKIYEDPPTVDPLDFNVVTTSAYSNQDGTGTIDVQDGGLTFYMEGNRWRATDQTFNVTAGTVLSFDFKSTSEGEIHGLGFDEDHELSNNQRVFRIFGTQAWTGDIDWSDPYTSGDLGNWRTFTIPVGDYYTGSNMMLILVNDYDAGSGNTSWFRNVRIYEP